MKEEKTITHPQPRIEKRFYYKIHIHLARGRISLDQTERWILRYTDTSKITISKIVFVVWGLGFLGWGFCGLGSSIFEMAFSSCHGFIGENGRFAKNNGLTGFL